ncbi:MAG TPA: hypothetical protein VGA16_09125 [Candidatus Limnocylindria bacterium]
MSNVVRAIWDNTYGLLVDDGRLALGALGAIAVSWLIASAAPTTQESVGWLLLGLIVALVLANVYAAGVNARRRAS